MNLAIDISAAPKLSKPSKMPCKSWSLEAGSTCPGSIGDDGELVPACSGCYALGGFYNMPVVKAVREHNRQDWKAADWGRAMVAAIKYDDNFRWFDSGDCYSVKLAEKIYAVMLATPHTMHWFPTRMHKFGKFAEVLAKMAALDNVVVRKSSDSITGETIDGATTSTIYSDDKQLPPNATICGAYKNKGKCGACRACWDKTVEVIAYPAHGAKMLKLAKAAA